MIAVTASLPDAPAPVGTLIEASFRVWWNTLRQCFPLALAPTLIGLLPALWMPQTEDPMRALGELMDWLSRPTVWLMYLVTMLISVLCIGALIYRMGMLGRGQDPGLTASISRGIERLPAAFAGWVLYLLLVLVSMLPWFLMLVMLFRDGEPTAGSVGLAFLGTLVLLGPPTWVSLAAGLFLFAVLLERRGAIGGLRRSFQLIYGQWWRSSVLIGVILAVYLSAVGVAAMVIGGFAAVVTLGLHGPEALQDSGWMFGFQLLFAPINAALQLLFYAGGLTLFNDLVQRKA